MRMPNIGIHGYAEPEALEQRIEACLKRIGQDYSITEIFRTVPVSCDGKKTRMPYLRIFSPELEKVFKILAGFSEDGICEDIEVISEILLFFSKDEMPSGSWKEKVRKNLTSETSWVLKLLK